jgi:hypothetical protein
VAEIRGHEHLPYSPGIAMRRVRARHFLDDGAQDFNLGGGADRNRTSGSTS